MSEATKAVFLSYASQDKEVAKRICDALRAAGIEVWFDQSELRGGDAWDAMIRKRIKECALFVPIITPTTNARAEGYFRLEWKLAVDRSHLMADDAPFLFPIVAGDVADATARVPDKFRDVQWTRLRLDETPAELADRVARLLRSAGASPIENREQKTVNRAAPPPAARFQWWMIFPIVGMVMGLVFAVIPFFRSVDRAVKQTYRNGHPAPPPTSDPKPQTSNPAPTAPSDRAQVTSSVQDSSSAGAEAIERGVAPVAPANGPQEKKEVGPVSPASRLAEKAITILDRVDVAREDLTLAEDLAQQAVKLDPSDGEAWAASSLAHGVYIYRGWDPSPARREESRVAAERAIRLAPKSVNARLAQAGAWASFNVNKAETEKLLREVLQEHPDHQPTLRFLAVIVLGRGQLEEALALNERSAALPGGDPLALYNNSRYLLQAGRQDEAYRTLQRSIAQKPFSSALVMKTLMEIYQKGDLAAAEATQRQIPPAVLLEDRANYISGLLRYYRRDAEGALRMWSSFPREAYADFQNEGPKGILIGYAYELDGRDAAAKIEWRTALALADKRLAAAPNNPARHYERAHLLACLGETAAATEALRTYEQLAGVKLGANAPMSFDLALIYARLGRYDELFAHWPGATPNRIRLDPRFDKVRADPRFATVVK